MMKNLLLVISLFYFNYNILHAQEAYSILKISTENVAKLGGKMLKVGDKISKNAKVKFDETQAYMHVFDGKDFLKMTSEGIISDSPDIGIVLGKSTGAGIIRSKITLKKFIESKNLLIIDKLILSIPESVYKLSIWEENDDPEGGFFFISYTYKGEEINKFLKVQEPNSFVLNDKIYTIDGKPIDRKKVHNMELRYAVDYETDILVGTGLSLICINTEDVKEEVEIIISNSIHSDKYNLVFQVENYLVKYYGSPILFNLSSWLKKHFPERF